ncbi:oligoendopeptidase F [bacterium]|nr:oligoendopeptidase F [bacterium]MBU1676683.1 oligoendopeptidase F [bacterium]
MKNTTAETAPRERRDVPDHLKWDLSGVYADWDAWENDYAAVAGALDGLSGLRGSLGESAAAMLHAIETLLDTNRRLELVRVFAAMKSDEDTRLGVNTERRGRAGLLGVKVAEAASWFEPELLAIDDAVLARFLAEEEGLRLYAHFLDDIRRSRPHTLDAAREELLAAAGAMARGAGNVFNALDNADLVFPAVRDEQGDEVELTKARYNRFVRSRDRRVREEAFVALHETYGRVANTLAANLDANINTHVFYARARNHPGTLEAALHDNAVPVDVFHNLVEAVNDNLPAIHRYTALKKRALGVDLLREFDLYAPLFADGEFTFTYEESCDLLLAALAPLGDGYVETVRRGIAERRIDVHESAGKRGGAYSTGAYDTPPFVLLNWSGQLRDTFTLAHEMGHSLHSWHAVAHQPYVYGDYPIFTAEVASTFNELLLMDHLLRVTGDRDRRLFLLDAYLDQLNGTVFRQTMFAEFEHAVHLVVERGGTLTADRLDGMYLEILARYWGPELDLGDALSARTWCRIPHFYYNYYVYQYATAFAASVALSRRVLAGGAAERDDYLGFMRSGSSRYPVDTLRRAGVDMTTPEPVAGVFALFTDLLDQVESLLSGE